MLGVQHDEGGAKMTPVFPSVTGLRCTLYMEQAQWLRLEDVSRETHNESTALSRVQ